MNGIISSNRKAYSPPSVAVFNKTAALSGAQPTRPFKDILSQTLANFRAAGGGSLSGFMDISILNSDVTAVSGLQVIDSLHMEDPNRTRISTNASVVTKTSKKGYSQTGNAGYLLSNTLIDTTVSENRTDFFAFWSWIDVQNVGSVRAGICIGTDTRGCYTFPKYDATKGYMGYAGRVQDFAQADGNTVVGFAVIGGNITFYKNGVVLSTQTTNWPAVVDYNSNLIHLGLNIGATPTPVSVGMTMVPAPVKIGAWVAGRPSLVNVDLVQSILSTHTSKVLALP